MTKQRHSDSIFDAHEIRALQKANCVARQEKAIVDAVILAEPLVKPKFALSEAVIDLVLSASASIAIVDKNAARLTVTLPSIDWLELGIRLLKQPLPDTRFEVNGLPQCRVMVSFFSTAHPRFAGGQHVH